MRTTEWNSKSERISGEESDSMVRFCWMKFPVSQRQAERSKQHLRDNFMTWNWFVNNQELMYDGSFLVRRVFFSRLTNSSIRFLEKRTKKSKSAFLWHQVRLDIFVSCQHTHMHIILMFPWLYPKKPIYPYLNNLKCETFYLFVVSSSLIRLFWQACVRMRIFAQSISMNKWT